MTAGDRAILLQVIDVVIATSRAMRDFFPPEEQITDEALARVRELRGKIGSTP